MGESKTAGPEGSRDTFTPPLAHGTWNTPFPPSPPPPSLFGPTPYRLNNSVRCTPGPTGPMPAPSVSYVLPALAGPTPFAFPPLVPIVGPAGQPPLAESCPANLFFGDPPTRCQSTPGTVLTPDEVAKRRKLVATAVSMAQTTRPLSAANLQNWLDAKSVTKVMGSADFLTNSSGVPQLLTGKTRTAFENACANMLRNRNDPHGTLLPDNLAAGNLGPVRFLQYEDGVNPIDASKVEQSDLYTALGSFNVHSAAWVRATYKGRDTASGPAKDVFDVQILRWCVQIYDVYDWNKGGIPVTPFPLTDPQVQTLNTLGPLTGGAFMLSWPKNTLMIPDSWFRDLEVSGGGRAFLVRSETFEAPQNAKGNFTFKIDPPPAPTQ